MSQSDILKYLYLELYTGCEGFFTGKEIAKATNTNPGVARRQLWKLYVFGFLEIKQKKHKGLFTKGFTAFKSFRLDPTQQGKIKAMLELEEVSKERDSFEETFNTEHI